APKFFADRAKGPVDAKTAFAKKEAPVSEVKTNKGGSYSVNVNGTTYNVTTGPAGDSMSVNVNGKAYNVSFGAPGAAPVVSAASSAAPVVSGGEDVPSPVAGTLLKHVASNGSQVKKGETVIMIESMKMELEVKAPCDGVITFKVQPGTQVQAGQALASIGGSVSQPAPAPVAAPASQAPAAPVPQAPVSSAPTGGKPVNAPVAGTLLKYVAQEGASVTADTTILLVESMKMELEIKAGSSGKVHFIAAPGSQISAGSVIAEIN
ncbi:MAG: oxaloacetate decarboxylase, partial [Treponema sp.]|nr:oxaloacetate decarboxylase [Treponema sp.]